MVILAVPCHRILSGQQGIYEPFRVKGIAQQKIPDGDICSPQPCTGSFLPSIGSIERLELKG
jgi:hypothetical protein